MHRHRRPQLQRYQIFQKVKNNNELTLRKERLLTYLYQRTRFYKWGLRFRLFFFVFFTFLFFDPGGYGSTHPELVIDSMKSSHAYRSKGTRTVVRSLQFSTEQGDYQVNYDYEVVPDLYPGDTVWIQTNFLGKPSHVLMPQTKNYHALYLNWVSLIVIAIFTSISLAFNSGADNVTRKITWLAILLDAFAFLRYLFTF